MAVKKEEKSNRMERVRVKRNDGGKNKKGEVVWLIIIAYIRKEREKTMR